MYDGNYTAEAEVTAEAAQAYQREQALIMAAQERIAKNKAQIVRAEQKIQQKAERQQRHLILEDAVSSYLDAHPIHYIRTLDRYLHPQQAGGYEFMTLKGLAGGIPEWSKAFADELKAQMDARGLIHSTVTYSFEPQPPDVFNLLDRSGWIQPADGEPHPVFAWLLRSLGSGKLANIEHIERVLCYKYMHPETYTLPALVIHGEAGVGKNALVETVLHGLFDGQTVATMARNVVGTFNSLIVGKAVVLLNEAVASKVDGDAVKALLGSRMITINEKGVRQFQAANTAMLIIGANRRGSGGIYLDRSNADRRYSVLRCDRTLAHWVAEATGQSLAEAVLWLNAEGEKILGDRAEIAKWIGGLIRRHGGQSQPAALHGEDFQRLMDRQKPTSEQVFEAVFTDPGFTHAERCVLFELYVAACRVEGTQHRLGRQGFYEELETWLASNRTGIRAETITERVAGIIGPRKRTLLLDPAAPRIDEVKKTDNRRRFVSGEGRDAIPAIEI